MEVNKQMRGLLWKQRHYEDKTHKAVPRRRFVILDEVKEQLCFYEDKVHTLLKEDENFDISKLKCHKVVPLDQIAAVEAYGDNGFLITMRHLATCETPGATFFLHTETDGSADESVRDEWVAALQNRVDCAAQGLHLVVKNLESIHDRYDCAYRGPKAILGTGMSGDVRLIVRKLDGKKFALKTVGLSGISESKLGSLRREIDLCKSLDHPHIVKLVETFIEPKLCCRLVMELYDGGELFERLAKHRYFSDNYSAKLISTMLKALKYLKTLSIVHRDLKLENWMFRNREPETSDDAKEASPRNRKKTGLFKSLNIPSPSETDSLKGKKSSDSAFFEDTDIVLIDFGLGRKYRDENEVMTRQVGTLSYVAPEVLNGQYCANTCDLWGLGVIAYMLLSGRAPFESKRDDEVKNMILFNDPDFSHKRFRQVAPAAIDFVKGLLEKDVSKRLSIDAAMNHPWFKVTKSFTLKGTAVSEAIHPSDNADTEDCICQDDGIVTNLRNFSKFKEFKRLAIEMIAFSLGHDEIKELTALFERMDTDNDGYIGYEELLSGLKGKCDAEEVTQIFNALDEENKGRIHVSEFVAGALQEKYHQEERFLLEAFSRLDVGKKGKITVGDLRTLLGKCASEKRIQEIWAQSELAHKQTDDEISMEEFIVFMRTDGEKDVAKYQDSLRAFEDDDELKLNLTVRNYGYEYHDKMLTSRSRTKTKHSLNTAGRSKSYNYKNRTKVASGRKLSNKLKSHTSHTPSSSKRTKKGTTLFGEKVSRIFKTKSRTYTGNLDIGEVHPEDAL